MNRRKPKYTNLKNGGGGSYNMCGIAGVIVKEGSTRSVDTARSLFSRLLLQSESRGKESSGMAVRTRDGITVFKRPEPASRLVNMPAYRKIVSGLAAPFTLIGHARLVTNGAAERNNNNQPVVRDGIVGIHNGIIVNDTGLWKRYPSLRRQTDVDTEVLLALIRHFLHTHRTLPQALSETFAVLEGSASVALLFPDMPYLALATNTGSLFYTTSVADGIAVFASEAYILKTVLSERQGEFRPVSQLVPPGGMLINTGTLEMTVFSLKKPVAKKFSTHISSVPAVTETEPLPDELVPRKSKNTGLAHLAVTWEKVWARAERRNHELRRCVRCVMPETMPFIRFDADGVCNFCRNYRKFEHHSLSGLEEFVSPYRKTDGGPDCIVAMSGGRDSSYALHYMKRVLKMHPVAYSYDWGMLTDLGRRNQARMCGKLGVEHILVSADIRQKRNYIRMNVAAWLKKPDIGTIPLFMAGDKQYFHYANLLQKQMDIRLMVYAENQLEKTDFKYGFCGVPPKKDNGHMYYLGWQKKFKLAFYYFTRFISNPAYINPSLMDTLDAFRSSYFIPHEYLYLFHYVPWDDRTVSGVLEREYNWEKADDTKITWRIGDGTAAFYNYIYYWIAGFTENDTFRSNQVREGMISRKEALRLAAQDNLPRYQSIIWYCDTIGLNAADVMERIHGIKQMY